MTHRELRSKVEETLGLGEVVFTESEDKLKETEG